MKSKIKIRHLECFVEVARHRTAVRAADALSVSQPAVSRTLTELERLVGAALFERRPTGLELTQYGDAYLQHASAVLASLRKGQECIDRLLEAGHHGVHVGALQSAASDIVPRAIRLAEQEHPKLAVALETGRNAVLLERLRAGELDLVVGRLAEPSDMQGLVFNYLFSEPTTIVVSPQHPLLETEDDDILRSMLSFPALIAPTKTLARNEFERFLRRHGGGSFERYIETDSVPFARSYLEMSDAVWIVSRGVVNADLNSGRLAELPIDTRALEGPVGVTTVDGAPPSVGVQSLVAALETVSSQNPPSRSPARPAFA